MLSWSARPDTTRILSIGLTADDLLHQFRAGDAGERQVQDEQIGITFTVDEHQDGIGPSLPCVRPLPDRGLQEGA